MTTFATPVLHVIPNGLQDSRVVRVVLLLLPTEDAAQTAWGLESWPKHAHELFDRLIGRDGEAAEIELTSPTGGFVARGILRDPTPNRRSDSARILGLWRSAVASGWYDFLGAATRGRKTASRPLPLPSVEAALLLPLERARASLTAMATAASPLHARPPLRPPLSTLSAHRRPWLGKPEELVRLAAMSMGRTTDGSGYLAGPPDLEEWAKAYAEGVIDPAHPFSQRLDPESIMRAALGEDGEDLLWLSDRMHALQHASLHTVSTDPPPTPELTAAGGRRLHQLLTSPGLMRLFGWARDALLEFKSDLPEGTRAVLVRPSEIHLPARNRTIAADLDVSRRGFFPASWSDWPNLTEDKILRQRGGVAVLSAHDDQRFAVTSCETVSGVEEDRQSVGASVDQTPALPRLVSGPFALMFLDSGDVLFPDTPNDEIPRDVLYAEDVAAPLRLDLGIELEGGAVSWHSTSMRTVVHRDPRASGAMRNWPARAIADFWPAWIPEHEREGAGVATLTFQQHQGAASGRQSRDCRLAAYGGEDLGAAPNQAPTTAAPGNRGAWLKPVVELSKAEDLQVSQHISVPGNKSLPPLRFGWPYRFGLRRTFLGGGGPRLDDARALYDQPDVPFPRLGAPAERYLRHEPVAKPVVMLAPGSPASGPGDPQTAAQMQVGTVAARTGTTRMVRQTSRVLLVPPVPFTFAELHDVFTGDGNVERGEIRVGLPQDPDSVQGMPGGGFQVTARRQVFQTLPVNAPPQGLVNAILESDTTGGQTAAVSSSAQPIPRFRIRALGEEREVRQMPYYPDPAACFLVLRLAHPGRPLWLDEPPLVIRVRAGHGVAGGARWPDVMPVKVDLLATNELRGRRLSADGIVELQGPIADTGPFAGMVPPAVSVQSITVRLAPGEEALLRAWFVPSVEDLESWFDVLRCSSGLCEMEGKKRGKIKTEDACKAGIASLLGQPTFGGADVPQLASLFQDHLQREPLAGLAEVHEMRLSHIVVRPRVAPKFSDGSARVARPRSFEAEVLQPFLAQAGPSRDWPTVLAEDGATSVLAAGSIEFDPATTSGLVVEALIRASGIEPLDRPSRALPSQFVPEESPTLEFGLTADGQARLEDAPGSSANETPVPRWVKVLALKDIPVPVDGRAGVQSLQLEEVLTDRSKEFAGAHVEVGAPLEQSQARQTVLRVLGIPRHGGGAGVPGLISPPLWIPATARPAAPDPADLSPLFRWAPEERVVDGESVAVQGGRASRLRLWLRRPWFTSGEGELLGIVLWPPQAFDLEDGKPVQLPFQVDALGELHDEDLGPLGRFVSVWGHDPIEGLATGEQRHRFLTRENFPSIVGDGSWQPHVLIPLAGTSDDPYALTSRETMAAASLLCPPVRFAADVSGGKPLPYVDLDLDLRGVASPRLRLGLVRFQPHARLDVKVGNSSRAGIRCSAPTAIEGALLPKRWYSLKATLLAGRHAGGSVTSLAVKLWGPTDGFDESTLRQRVTVELVEIRGDEEIPVQVLNIPSGTKPAGATWMRGARNGMGHVWSGGISTWTAVFQVPGNLMAGERNIVAHVREDLILPSTHSSTVLRELPQFSATVSLKGG